VLLHCHAKGLFPLRRCVALRLKAFKRVATRRNALHGALLRVAARCSALRRVERGGDIFGKNINELIWPTNTKIVAVGSSSLLHIRVTKEKKKT